MRNISFIKPGFRESIKKPFVCNGRLGNVPGSPNISNQGSEKRLMSDYNIEVIQHSKLCVGSRRKESIWNQRALTQFMLIP